MEAAVCLPLFADNGDADKDEGDAEEEEEEAAALEVVSEDRVRESGAGENGSAMRAESHRKRVYCSWLHSSALSPWTACGRSSGNDSGNGTEIDTHGAYE